MARDLLDGTEPGREGVLRLAERALALRAGAAPERRDGKRVVGVFFDPSLRTRTSMEAACAALGAHPIVVQPGVDAWGWEHRDGVVMNGGAAEHVREAVPVLAQYADLLAVRCFASDPMIDAFVRWSDKPVINLESPRGHPMQGLADAATWRARLGPDLTGQPICLTWAPHPKALPRAVPHQVLSMAALLGMDVRVARPDDAGLDLDASVVARATSLAAAAGGQVTVTGDRERALRGARVVYAKAWGGPVDRPDWRVDDVPQGAGFMHCLPVRRNVVVADAVLDGAQSWVQEQAGLRLWTAMAALEQVLAGRPWA
jgi:N-acetylornithine carbamoyltransferase